MEWLRELSDFSSDSDDDYEVLLLPCFPEKEDENKKESNMGQVVLVLCTILMVSSV